MFPTATSACRRSAAITEIESSGRDVPTATNVNPMTASETPKLSAIPTAPISSTCDPEINSSRPMTTAATVHPKDFGKAVSSSASALLSVAAGAWMRSLQ